MVAVPQLIESANLLLVEGAEDKRFLSAILKHWGRTNIQAIEVGKNDLVKNVGAVVLTRGMEQVSLVVISQDADENPRGAFDRIKSACRGASLNVPTAPWMPTKSSPVVVGCVFPDGENDGDLERLLLVGLREQSALTCVEKYFDCFTAQSMPLPRQIYKARVHAYLASLERPDIRMGEAAEAGLLPYDSPEFKGAFEQFLGLFPPL